MTPISSLFHQNAPRSNKTSHLDIPYLGKVIHVSEAEKRVYVGGTDGKVHIWRINFVL